MCVFAVISACFPLWLLVVHVSSVLTVSLYFLETVEILRLRLKFFWRRFVAYLMLLIWPLFVRTSLWWRVLRGDLSHASPLPTVGLRWVVFLVPWQHKTWLVFNSQLHCSHSLWSPSLWWSLAFISCPCNLKDIWKLKLLKTISILSHR